jgi:putative transposase
MAVLVVTGITCNGEKEILAVEPMEAEREETYAELFSTLKARGVQTIWLSVSDAHAGLQAAIRKSFLGSSWQRCKVHFMRHILSHVLSKEKETFAAKLKQIWCQPDRDSALKYADSLIAEAKVKYSKAIECLGNGLEESLQFYVFLSLTLGRSLQPTSLND